MKHRHTFIFLCYILSNYNHLENDNLCKFRITFNFLVEWEKRHSHSLCILTEHKTKCMNAAAGNLSSKK